MAVVEDPIAALEQRARALTAWLFDEALPFSWRCAADHLNGGFHEKIAPDGTPVDEPRRARVVARQLFVFSTAAQMGWPGPSRLAIRHALAALVLRHTTPEGALIPLANAVGHPLDSRFDLYDHAFALFGLAAACAAGEQSEGVAEMAERLVQRMWNGWKHPDAGFEEATPRTLPLKANPHMHLLEASLAWNAAAPGDRWHNLADEIVSLCLTRFIDPESGALHEFYDGDWRVASDPRIDLIEPGHQFEWAWLLLRWGAGRGDDAAMTAARRLIEIGERHGVDGARELAVDALDARLAVTQPMSRLWPQTERIKAWAELAVHARHCPERHHAVRRATAAAESLMRYLDHPVRGSWWENIDSSLQPVREPARTSSLYHLTCAIDVLNDAVTRLRRS